MVAYEQHGGPAFQRTVPESGYNRVRGYFTTQPPEEVLE
jgi:hypothetical protein